MVTDKYDQRTFRIADVTGSTRAPYYTKRWQATDESVGSDGENCCVCNLALVEAISSKHDWQYRHQGDRLSGYSGLVHFRNRELSVTLGRWTTNDPIGIDAGDFNWVRYVGNNGVNAVDPNGLLE